MTATLSMVMAMDNNRLIGKDNGMPWHIPGEQAYFKDITMGKPIIMGRKTHESIGRVLPGRKNIVITRNADWQAEGVETCLTLEAALEVANQESTDEIMIIGGAAVCELAMPQTDRLYLTVIEGEYEGDTWLTSYHEEEWEEVSCKAMPAQEGVPAFRYLVLERKGQTLT